MTDAQGDGRPDSALVIPYLVVPDVDALIDFVEQTFDAEINLKPMRDEEGRVIHAEVKIGRSRVMMGGSTDEYPPQPAMLYVYVDDADERHERAVAAGGTSVMEPEDQPHGDRYGGVRDPQGNTWYMAHRVRDVPEAEYRAHYEGQTSD